MRRLVLLFSVVLLAGVSRPLLAGEKPFAFGNVRFEANRGQTDSAVRYLARARGQQIFFTDTGITFAPKDGAAVQMRFAGAGKTHWTPDGAPSDSISYYIGGDSTKWILGASVYDRLLWRDVYPGIDLIFYGHADRLEYDLILAPGADPSRVRLQFDGAARVHGNADGSIELRRAGVAIRQRAPDIYQQLTTGKRRQVTGGFVRAGADAVRLRIGSYRRSQSLVIDPVIELATYLGGENDDEVVAIADGCVAGNTRSIAFPATNPTLRQGRDIFIRGTGAVNPNQPGRNSFTGMLIIGGSGDDELAGVSLDTNGYGYLAGTTTSTDFPMAGSSKYKGGVSDGFFAVVGVSQFLRLNSSLFIGGSGEDRINSFTGNNSIFALAGVTDSPDLPVVNTPQNTIGGGKDAFYGIISGAGLYATYGYLGGTGDDIAYAVSIRSFGEIWVGGETRSADFPFAEPGLAGPSDAFLAKVTSSLYFQSRTGLPSVDKISSYRIGGAGEDSIRAVVASPSSITSGVGSDFIYRPETVDGIGFAGVTTSEDLPIRNAAQERFGGERDGFAGTWDATAASPRWLTYLGGSGADEATAISQNWAGDLYVGGWTRSTDLPVVQAVQPQSAGGEDGMFAVLDSRGGLQQLTYFGGSGDDRIRDTRAVYNSLARVAGSTTSSDLPQRLPWQDRGARVDGFVADIGSDYIIGPGELIVAKDGVLSFSLRAARTAFREPVTYRSTDPSRVRFVYLGRSVDEVTAAFEDYVAVEGLADSGEAEIIASASGFTSKTIRVRLYPGVFVPSFDAGATPLSTWSNPVSLYPNYRAIDPVTNELIGAFLSIRPELSPVFKWSVSDPSVMELLNVNGGTQLQPRQAGSALLTLTIDGFRVLSSEQVVAVAAPRFVPPTAEFRLGKNLYRSLPITFGVNGASVFSNYRGTLTARSADPNRLLLSASADQPGRETVSIAMATSFLSIWAQALAGDGPVQVIFTSSEFDGEIPMTVTLEPAIVTWGGTRYDPYLGNVIEPLVSLTTGADGAQLTFSLQGESGSTSSGYRPGAPPVIWKLSNSNPQVVELNRITATGSLQGTYTVRPIAPGTSELSLAVAGDVIRLTNATVHVDVQAAVPPSLAVTLPSAVWVGGGLQTSVDFRYQSTERYVDLVSDDASAVLVSASAQTAGADRLTLPATSSDSYLFYLQALKSEGETHVRVRFPGGAEREIKVILRPAGAGFNGFLSGSLTPGSNRSAGVSAWALDRESGVGIFRQLPQPGPGITVRFRSEGVPVRLLRDSTVLTADAPDSTLAFAALAAGEEATLIAETTGGFTNSPAIGRLKITGGSISDTTNIGNITLARDEIRRFDIPSTGSTSSTTVTSSDPGRVLVSPSDKDPGSEAVQLASTVSSFYIQALAASGIATLRLETPGLAPREIKVALQPLQLYVYTPTVTIGATSEFQIYLNINGSLRPGAGPYRVNLRLSNPSVATVDATTFEFSGTSGTNSTGAYKLHVTGLSAGATQLIFDGPQDLYLVPNPITISIGEAQPPLYLYTLGKNLQGSAQISLGAGFGNPNGSIVTLTSSDPSILLLSRSSSVPGAGSVTVAVPAAGQTTQQVYFQAIGVGEAALRVVLNGVSQQVATVRLMPSWFGCGSQQITLVAGNVQSVGCGLRYSGDSSSLLQEINPRVGLGDLTLHFSSTAPEVFTITPDSVSLSNYNQTTVRAIAPGSGEFRVVPLEGFGSAPDGSDVLQVTVLPPALSNSCSKELVLGKDAQIPCYFSLPLGVTVSATSENPSLLLVSSDDKILGAASATATVSASGQILTFALQALSGYGTAEILFTARGYQDLRIPVVLRASEFYFSNSPNPPTPLLLRIGNTATLTIGMRTSGGTGIPRADVSIPVDLSMTPAGIVSLEPVRITFNQQLSNGEVRVKGLAAGSTLIRMTAPDGFLVPAAPLAASVAP